MEKCINAAKRLIDDAIKYNALPFDVEFTEYSKSYFITNENINGYLSLVNLENKDNALTVLASGDHAFNLITKGIMDIDTFDVNRLTEFVALGLKRAMILKYSYEEFLAYSELLCSECVTIEFISDTIYGLFPFMDSKHRMFWQEVLDYNYKKQKECGTDFNLIKILCTNTGSFLKYSDCNSYLLNKENYDLLRSRLTAANITFKNANALHLSKFFDKQYDVIMLSNILDYADSEWGFGWSYADLRRYEKSIEDLSKDNAVNFLAYIFDFIPGEYLLEDSTIAEKHLTDEEILTFPSASRQKNSAMILKRIQK